MIQVMIFGTGKGGMDFYQFRNKELIKVLAFVDNNKDKWGTKIYGRGIISPDQITKYHFDYIVVASSFYNEITRQLEEIGIDYSKLRYTCREMDYSDFFEGNYVSLYAFKYAKRIVKKMVDKQLREERDWNLPREKAVIQKYKEYSGHKPDLVHPSTFDEKIQFLQLYLFGQREADCTDKIKAREYIKERGLEKFLPKLYKTYDSADEINFDQLPKKCVLKVNNGAGYNVICKDKKKISSQITREELNRWMKEEYGKRGLEFHYALIKPRILCEEYIDNGLEKDIIDYKIHCFSGQPHAILVCSERSTGLKLNYYDIEWMPLNYEIEDLRGKGIEKPVKLKEMLEIATKLSEPFPFVRVDLYCVNEKIYIGELTFTPMCGRIYYLTERAQKKLGKLVDVNYVGG